ncbi:MAG: TRAP transporter small permease [Gammaproteobacteria bacterium]|jgi:TRAP-type C4-dicarboxylate transport system permease small subunit|nr:MAG: TRAP transporter small permease [Gammaproteobacteria bacterium]
MDPVSHSRAEGLLLLLAALAIAVLCAIVTLTVVSRWFDWLLIPDEVLLVRELMVAVILLPLAAVTARRLHIAVTLFTGRIAGRCRRQLARLGGAVGLLFVGLLLWAGIRNLAGAVATGEYHDGEMQLPVFVAQAVYVLGLGACCLRLVVQLVRPEADRDDPGPGP